MGLVRLVIGLALTLGGLYFLLLGLGVIGSGTTLQAIWGAVILIFGVVILLTGLGRKRSSDA